LNLVYIFSISFILFLIGLFSVLFFNDIIKQIISIQFILASSLINFLSFSQTLYDSSTIIIIFVLLSVFLIILFQFLIIIYLYLNFTKYDFKIVKFENSLFYFNLKEWMGEE
jgi:NADH:ubiquinone oxidoreductase subunit K